LTEKLRLSFVEPCLNIPLLAIAQNVVKGLPTASQDNPDDGDLARQA